MANLFAIDTFELILLVSALVVVLLAWKLRWLTLPAALGGLITSVSSITFGGAWWYLLGILVFVFGSGLSQFRRFSQQKSSVSQLRRPRRLVQVAAYSVPTIGLLILQVSDVLDPTQAFLAYVAVLATATSDNTATEIGKLSAHSPRLITNGKSVPTGTSGGITSLGLAASTIGAIIVPLFLFLIPRVMIAGDQTVLSLVIGLSTVGLCGSLFDSLLGATLQAKYRCLNCSSSIETPVHGSTCGGQGKLVSGIAIISNEIVNGLTASFAAVATLLIWR